MWKEIKIGDKTFFLECKMVKNFVMFMLYDLKQSWYENVELTEVVQRAKELNKRIQFDKLTVLDTLVSANAVDGQLTSDVGEHELTLKLKYRIDEMPFHFKWHLEKQQEQEFRAAVTLPLFEAVHGMRQQLEELRSVIAKKDKELKQYKDDGAILRITTVATQPFSFAEFDEKYAEVNKISKGFQQLGESLMQQIEAEKQLKEQEEKPKHTSVFDAQPELQQAVKKLVSKKPKNSPRSKKRKVLDMQQQRMAIRLNEKKQKLEYESSQSQSLTDSPPEIDAISQELLDIKQSWLLLEKRRLADLNGKSDSSLND